jgi:hypothetical protein
MVTKVGCLPISLLNYGKLVQFKIMFVFWTKKSSLLLLQEVVFLSNNGVEGMNKINIVLKG